MLNKIKSLGLILLSVLLFSCSKTEIYNYEIENVTVTLEAKELISKVSKPFVKRASLAPIPTTENFVHEIPSTYTAYFIADETKGQYSKDDIISEIQVTEGSNTITIPKLKYRVIVTSYTGFSDNELKHQDALSKLPSSSNIIHLLGQNNIDYSNQTTGTVEVKNPYAAVMISNNRWVTDTPVYNTDGGTKFNLVDNNAWYLLYIKAPVNGNIGVYVDHQKNYHSITANFEPNTIYEYVFNGVGDVEGDFIVSIEEIFKVVKQEVIDLY